jgi:predicted kinase
MFILLNGPLGIGKSTLAEALTERLDRCVMLDGDVLVEANPPADDETDHLHTTIALLVEHHRRFGYSHFVIDHLWRSPAELDDLRRRLAGIDPGADIHCFLLTLPLEENRRRIDHRQRARAVDEREFERRTSEQERQLLADRRDLGEPLDVSAPPEALAARLLRRIGAAPEPGDALRDVGPGTDGGPKLLLLCGKMAAGKSRLARDLARRERAVLLVEDDFLEQLFGSEIVDVASYVRCSTRVKTALTPVIADLLGRGLSVVLDFPGNTKRQRAWFRQLLEASGVDHELHYVDAADEVCKRQLRERSRSLPPGSAWTSEAEFDLITASFDPPTHEEGFTVIRHARGC